MDNLPIRTEVAVSEAVTVIDLQKVADVPGIVALRVAPDSKVLLRQGVTEIDSFAVTYEVACRALAMSKNVAAVKDILSIAAAMDAYARQTSDRSLEWDAIELRFCAECRLDQMIADQNDEVDRRTVA
jgi:hypothetical protein